MLNRVCAVFAVVFCCVLGVPAGADDLPDATTLAARISAAEGTAPPNYRETIVATGPSGKSVETIYHRVKDKREIVDQGPIRQQTGTYNGEDWHQTLNGLTVADEPDPGLEKTETVTTTVSRAPGQPETLVLSKLNARGYGTRQYVDAATYHVLREIRIDALGSVTTDYDAFTAYGPQTLPAHWVTTDARVVPAETTTSNLTQYVTGDVTDTDVAQPAGRSIVQFPEGVTSVDLPARFESGHIYVRVNVAGRGLDFILDTGSSDITLSPDVARQLGLTLTNRIAASAARSVIGANAVIPSVTVGALKLNNLVVTVIPFRQEIGNMAAVGLLGFDFLATLGITIDYENHRVTVHPASAYTPPAGSGVYPIDVRFREQVPETTVSFDGAVGDRFIIDTGADGTFMLFDYFARRYPEIFHRAWNGPPIIYYGVGGQFDARAYVMDAIKVGPVTFKDFIGYRVVSAGSYANADDGLIGSTFLHLFTLDLDYTNGRVYLRTNTLGHKLTQ